MKLSELIKGLEARVIGEDIEVKGLSSDTRTLKNSDVFFVLKGQRHDGADFIDDAVRKGAAAIVTDREIEGLLITQVIVSDTLDAMAYIASRFYGEPSKKQEIIGITGTNGKTTTAWLVFNILKSAGIPVALLGTLQYLMPDGSSEKASLTTPQSIKWQSLLEEAYRKGAKATVAEVSSHGLALKRVNWTDFKVSVFTNLSRDHLDFHKDMEDYFQAKAMLFRKLTGGQWVINIDDPYGKRLASEAGDRLVSYGLEDGARVRAIDWSLSINGVKAIVTDSQTVQEIHSSHCGLLNLYNILASVAVAKVLGISWEIIKDAIGKTPPVEGRLQKIETDRGFTVFIDYAHTPDALQKVLETLRPLTSGKIITVFGCGGNRDRGKRPIMGRVASELSDMTIVTSDNPRWENPEEIIKDIVKGMNNNYKVIPDRMEAIAEALKMASERDIVLIAGKGHENYQEINGKRFHFSDYETVVNLLSNKTGVSRV